MVAGSASGSASSAGPSSDGGGDGDAHWRALQPGGIPTLKSILSSTLFFAEAAVGALQARNAEVAPYTSEWPAAAALILNLERKRDEWRNVSREFNRERIPFARLANTCDARQGGNVTGPTEYECSLFHLLDASRGGDPSCPHRPPVAVTECECHAGASSGGIVGCSISHLRAWNHSRAANRNSPFQVRRASDGGPSRSRRTHARTCADPRVCALPAAFHVPQVIAEDDALLQVGVARMDLLAAVSEASRITNGNWSSIIFSPSRPDCLPDCQPCAHRRSNPAGPAPHGPRAPRCAACLTILRLMCVLLRGLRRWNSSSERQVWFQNSMATDAWTTMYVISPRGMDARLSRAASEGFGSGIDLTMFDQCPDGECFTLYSGDGQPRSGVLSQDFQNVHNTIHNLGFLGFPLWAISIMSVGGVALAAVLAWCLMTRCKQREPAAKAPLASQ